MCALFKVFSTLNMNLVYVPVVFTMDGLIQGFIYAYLALAIR